MVAHDDYASDKAPTRILAIYVSRGRMDHSGIVVRSSDDSLSLVDLMFRGLGSRPLQRGDGWVEICGDVDDFELDSVRSTLAAILRQKALGRSPSYGLTFDGQQFDVDGKVVNGPSGSGLTCVTFVMAVFASCGVELLARNEWPARSDDDHNVRMLLNGMRWEKVSDETIREMEQQQPTGVRFRPRELAGGANTRCPCPFEDARDAALSLERQLG
jgi:hypothetical protein